MKVEDIFKETYTFETERLIIRNLEIEDAKDMFEYASNPEVVKYLPWECHRSINDTIDFLKVVIDSYNNHQVAAWGIEYKSNKKMIGTCGFVWWKPEDSKAEIGYALSQDYWNKGIMTEAVKQIINFGFTKMNLNRIEAHCVKENIGSERIMQKMDMKYEGLLREYRKFKGEYKDFKMYSILKKEYFV